MRYRGILLTFLSFTTMMSPVLAQTSKTSVGTSGTTARVKVGPLGDLSAFRVILQDTLALVRSGKSKEAVTRIRAFEVLWDNRAQTLSGKDNAKWTTIDGAADVALGAVRSSTATKAESTRALENLISLINAG